MSSYLIIDGYNLIGKWPELIKARHKSIELARSELYNLIQSYCDHNGHKGIIIFDGRGSGRTIEAGSPAGAHYASPTIIFSAKRESADTVIESLVYNLEDKKEARVVTDDRVVANLVTGMGAFVTSTALFHSECYGGRS